MPKPGYYDVGLLAYFKDLGAAAGLTKLSKAAGGLGKTLENIHDKTIRVTGATTEFANSGKEMALGMSTNLRRTAVLQGKTASNNSEISAQQLKITSQVGENISSVEGLQKAFEDVGKPLVGRLGDFAEFQKTLEVSPEALASYDKTLESLGLTEDGVVSLTKEIAGMALGLNIPPPAIMEDLSGQTDLVNKWAATFGKKAPEDIRRFLKENVALSAGLTATGVNVHDANTAVNSLGTTMFESAQEMQKSLAGVSDGAMPDFLQKSTLILGDFQTAFSEAARMGPMALFKTLREKTKFMKKNFGDDQQLMNNWRAWLDETVHDPTMVRAIVEDHGEIGKAVETLDKPMSENIKNYGTWSDAIINAEENLRNQRDAAYDALKATISQKMTLPLMAPFWKAQKEFLRDVIDLTNKWASSTDNVKKSMAAILGSAGIIALHGGEVVDWLGKFGDSARGVHELNTALEALNKVKLASFLAELKAVSGPLGLIVTVAGILGYGATKLEESRQTRKDVSQVETSKSITTSQEHLKKFVPMLEQQKVSGVVGASETMDMYLKLKKKEAVYNKDISSMEAEGYDRTPFYFRQKEALGQIQGELANMEAQITKQSPVQAHAPTPVLPSGAFPPDASSTRFAIQGLEEQRAQVHLLEQIAALLGGGFGGAAAPARGGGGNVIIEIRPDSGPMKLHEILRATVRKTLGRGGYNQFGGTVFAN